MSQNEAGDSLEPGSVFAERYEIRSLVGRGGMGAVYEVFDTLRHETIALKVVTTRGLDATRARDRFVREATIATTLSHHGIVRCHDIQQYRGEVFMTMELLRGKSLADELRDRRREDRSFSVDEVVELGRSLCTAVAYAHETTVHRDLKPANVFLSETAGLKVLDFGLAYSKEITRVSLHTFVAGTPGYMAPEQMRDARTADHRADQFAICVILFELLTGERPLPGDKSLRQRRPEVPAWLADAIELGLAPDPADRHATVSALGHTLEEGQPAASRWWWSVGAGLAVVAVGVLLWQRPWRETAKEPPDPGENLAVQSAEPSPPASEPEAEVLPRDLARSWKQVTLALDDWPPGPDAWQARARQAGVAERDEIAALLRTLDTLPADSPDWMIGRAALLERVREFVAWVGYRDEFASELHKIESRLSTAGAADWSDTQRSEVADAYVRRDPSAARKHLAQFEQRAEALLREIAIPRGKCPSGFRVLPASRPDEATAGHADLVEHAATGMRFVLVPAAVFTMGSPEGEEGRRRDGETERRETVEAYYLAETEVTQGQWTRVLPRHENPSPRADERLPVEGVEFEEALAFLVAINEGRTAPLFRLPTEVEWEYACRGHGREPFSTGAQLTREQANFDSNERYGRQAPIAGRNQATPVGTFDANPRGFYDLHGNVQEWVAEQPGGETLLRGGAYTSGASHCRSAARRPARRSWKRQTGFRVALSLE